MREKIEILNGNPITGIGSYKMSEIDKLESDYEELEKCNKLLAEVNLNNAGKISELENKLKIAVDEAYKSLDLIDLRERSTVIDEYAFYDKVKNIRNVISSIGKPL